MSEDTLADVVAIEPAALAGMGGREGSTVRTVEQALEQGRGLSPCVGRALSRALGQDGMDLVSGPLVDDGFVLAGITLSLVHHLADIGRLLRRR